MPRTTRYSTAPCNGRCAPRAWASRRFTSSGLSIAGADAYIPDLLEFAARPRTNAQVEDWLEARVGDNTRGVRWALIDGYVAGVWRPADGGIEATAFHRLSEEACRELRVEAASLVSFLQDREAGIHRRYVHWWKKLPRAEVRLLPG